MNQVKINDILYILTTEAYEITEDTDAATIYVQEGYVEDFVELNESLEDKIEAYNYLTMVVNEPVWAQYVGPTGAPVGPTGQPEPVSPTYTITDNSFYVALPNGKGTYDAAEDESMQFGPSEDYGSTFNGTELNNMFWIVYNNDRRETFDDFEFDSETGKYIFNMPAAPLEFIDTRDYNVVLAETEYSVHLEVDAQTSIAKQPITVTWMGAEAVPQGLDIHVTDFDGNNSVTVTTNTDENRTTWTFDMPEYSVLITPYTR